MRRGLLTVGLENISKSSDAVDQKRKRKEEPGASVTEESLEKIKNAIKLHYMRTRGPAEATRYLYGKNLDGQSLSFLHALHL